MIARKSVAIALFLLPLASGCVSMGANYDPTAVANLQPGMTRAEVEKVLGKPTTVATVTDGSSQVSWVHSEGSMLGAKARMVVLQFNAQGRFVRMITSSESNIR